MVSTLYCCLSMHIKIGWLEWTSALCQSHAETLFPLLLCCSTQEASAATKECDSGPSCQRPPRALFSRASTSKRKKGIDMDEGMQNLEIQQSDKYVVAFNKLGSPLAENEYATF